MTDVVIDSGGVRLAGHLARPASSPRPGTSARLAVVICGGFPSGAGGATTATLTYPELADRVAVDPGWTALNVAYRGTGKSEGDFSLAGWLADIHTATTFLLDEEGVAAVWLAGFGTGGALTVCAAAEDARVRGVAALGAPSDFNDWSNDVKRFLEHLREIGAITSPGFPKDVDGWARELREVRPIDMAAKIPPRPFLLVHGSQDEVVPPLDARALSEAAHGEVELRLLMGGGHELRHDPRAIAILLGWLGRQRL